MAEISIIVPVYRVEPYLRRCVDSILGQSFRDFELILVDDGSPDNCGAICEDYAATDARVFVIHQANGGLSAARNAGLDWMFANSDSRYVTFVDSDDWVSAHYLEELLRGLGESDGISCVAFAEVFAGDASGDSDGREAAKWLAVPPHIYWLCLARSPMVVWAKLYRRDFWRNVRFPVGKIHEDEYVSHRILFSASQIAYSPTPLYYYFRHTDSIIGVEWSEKRLDALEAFQDQIAYFGEIGQKACAESSKRKLLNAYVAAIENKHLEYRPPLRKLLLEVGAPPLSNERLYRAAHPVRRKIVWPFLSLFDAWMRRGLAGALRLAFHR